MTLRSRAFIAFILAITLFQLGLAYWQWQRMDEKAQLIATVTAKAKAAPRPLAGAGPWDRVSLRGRFVHDRSSYVRTSRPEPKPGTRKGPGQQGGFGVFVLTPFITQLCDSTGKCQLINIYVNRGFLPTRPDGKLTPFDRPAGPVTVTGFIRPSEREGWLPPYNDPGKQVWFLRSIEAMAQQVGLPGAENAALAAINYNRFVDLEATDEEAGGPFGIDAEAFIAAIPNNHWQYVLTWLALAGTNVVVLMFFLASRHRRGTKTA